MTDNDELRELAKSLAPIDDIMFRLMARDRNFCQEILQVILADKNLVVKENTVQSVLTNLGRRSVVLDTKCLLGNGQHVNIEVQKEDDDDHQRRVRYNAALMTANITKAGNKFKNVPDVIVVYISRKDIFKPHPVGRPRKDIDDSHRKAIYHIDRVIRELNIIVDNGFTEIYVNAEIDDGSEVSELMKVFSDSSTYNDKFPNTSKMKRIIKETEGDVTTMSEEMRLWLNKKQAEAVDEKMTISIKNLMTNLKISAEQAMTAMGISPSDFKKYSSMLSSIN